MKLTNSVVVLAAAVVLAFGSVGCKKRIQKVTPLPGTDGAGLSRNLNDGPAGLNDGGVTGGGIPMGPNAFDNWIADEQMFAEQTVYFDFDKSSVRPSEIPKLQTVRSRMQSMSGKALRIEGHADERGTEGYNDSLGEKRAQSVRESLVGMGMDPNMITTVSFGESRPADPGHSPEAWAKNRRGQIILLSPPGNP